MARRAGRGGNGPQTVAEVVKALGGALPAAQVAGTYTQTVYRLARANNGVQPIRIAVAWADALHPDDPVAWRALVRSLVPQ